MLKSYFDFNCCFPKDLCGNSDDFFLLETLPKKVAVLGAGYIAVELAGVLNGLGSETHLFVRGAKALRNFDSMLSTHLDTSMRKAGTPQRCICYTSSDQFCRDSDRGWC